MKQMNAYKINLSSGSNMRAREGLWCIIIFTIDFKYLNPGIE